jgi:LPS export ABC transporter protein LptC
MRWLPLLAALCGLGACKNDLDQLASIDVNADAPDRITTEAEYFYSDSGHVRNRLRAGRVSEYVTEGKQRTEMTDSVELVFFDPHGGPVSTLTALRALISPKKQRMEVFQHVIFINSRGERMETEHLVWSQDSARVYTDSAVKITRAQDVIYGEGLDADEDFSRYTLRKITGTLFVQPGDTASSTPTD